MRRIKQGYIDTITPTTTSGESRSQHARRRRRMEYPEDIRRRTRIRRIIIVILACLVVACIAVGVGIFAFFTSLDGKIALQDSDADTVLVPTEEDDEAFYTLVAADLDENDLPSMGDGPDMMMLLRIDPQTQYAAAITVPADIQVELSDGKSHPLSDAQSEGDAALISAVSTLLGIDINHYIKTDAAAIEHMTDSLDGVEVDVSEEIDDPSASDLYIPAGNRTLNGEQMLTFLRASNFAEGTTTQMANQREGLIATAMRLLSGGTFDFYFTLDKTDGGIRTDATVSGGASLADAMRGIDAESVYGAVLPGYESTDPGANYYVFSSEDWPSMQEALEAGEDPDPEETVKTVDPGSFTITVRNGSGEDGGAAQVEKTLNNMGFKVTDTGNTDEFAYDETLVVYHDESGEAAAQTVIQALGEGRPVEGGDYYSFDTDVLVILGADWKPTS